MRNILYALLLLATAQVNATAQTDNFKKSTLHLGLIYPISSNGKNAGEYDNDFSLNLLAGVSGSEEACVISGLCTIVRDKAQGVQVAGLTNFIGNTACGVEVAGIANIVKVKTEGLQVAGIMNLTDTTHGAQIAGVINIAKNTSDGLQIAGLANLSTNINTQVAGIINNAQKVDGIQIAVVNNAKSVKGAQISGLVNKAHKVKGIQIGCINIADTGDYTIGIINLLGNGEKAISLTVDEMSTTIVAFRSGGRRLYNILGVGYNFKTFNGSYALEGGLGLHVPVTNSFLINIEGVSTTLADFKHDDYLKAALRTLAVYKVSSAFEIFAGPSVNTLFPSDKNSNNTPDTFPWNFNTNSKKWSMGIGGVAGLQVCF